MGSADEPSIEDAIDALFAGPLEDFTAARNALAKRCKASGDAKGAAQVKALAKPSLSAWVVNQLWWSHRSALDEVLTAGDRIRAASMQGAGPAEQAAASKARRNALTALSTYAEAVLAAGGHATAASTMRKVTTSLEAAAGYGTTMPEPPLGRRSTDLTPLGFDMLAALGGTPAANSAVAMPTPQPEPPPSPAATAADPKREVAQRALHAAQVAADAAAREVDALGRTADEHQLAAQHADDAHQTAQRAVREATRTAEAAELALRRTTKLAETTAAALQRAHALLRQRNLDVAAAEHALKQLR